MSLRRLLERMDAGARECGEASATLAGGATLLLRADRRRRQLVIGRQGAPVGTVEEQTFRAHGHIPADAVAVCWLPDARGVYRLSLSWEAPPETLFDLL